MNEAFCCFGLLRMRERVEGVIGMLPEPRRAEALRLLEEYAALSGADILKRLDDMRRRQAEESRGCAGLSPVLRRWLHGREDR